MSPKPRLDAASWTEERIHDAIAFVASRLDADFAHTGLPAIDITIDPQWAEDLTQRPDSNGSRSDDVVVRCGGHEFPLWLQAGVETAVADAANALQDDAIHQVGHAWPELLTADGSYVGVLVPACTASAGIALWHLDGTPFCAVGHLVPACRSASLTIRGAPAAG